MSHEKSISGKMSRVRPEAHEGSAPVGLSDHCHGTVGHAARVLLAVGLAVEIHLDQQAFAERVDDGETYSVQTTRNLVAATAELSTGVERREDDLERGLPGGRMHPHRDAAAVVEDGHGVVRVQHDLDRVAPTGEGLVDAVVDELDDEVVQTTQIRGSDVHPGASANRLETLEDLDLIGRVRGLAGPADAYRARIRIAVCMARPWARLWLVRRLIGAFGACGVGYVCCSGCDVNVKGGANGETARLFQRGPLKSAVPSTCILPACGPTSLVSRGALH